MMASEAQGMSLPITIHLGQNRLNNALKLSILGGASMTTGYKGLKAAIGAALVVGTLFGIAGCKSTTEPTDADAKAVYNDILHQVGLAEKKQLIELKKIDGQSSDRNGVKYYTFFYEAKVKYLQKIGSYQLGQVYTEKSNYGFQRTEKGWQGPDGVIYPD